MSEQWLKRLPWLGLLIAVLFWLLDAFVDVTFFHVRASFLDSLLNPSPMQLWIRGAVLVLALAIFWYAHKLGSQLIQSLHRLKDRETELVSHRDQQQVLRRQADEMSRRMQKQETEQEALRRLAYIDPLTGLYNRRRIEEIVEAARQTEELSQTGLGVMFCDIDHFKAVNESFGHFEGDKILVKMGQMLKEHFRRGDAIGRWGGEEFLVVLPNVPQPVAEVIAEDFRARVERESHPPKGKMTVSLGLAMLKPGESAESLLQRADRALIKAKLNGRNRLYINRVEGGAGRPRHENCMPFAMNPAQQT